MNRFCFLLLVVLFSSAKLILERATFRWVSIMCINYEPLITVSSYKRDPHRFFFLRRTFSIERKKTPGEVRCARDAAAESMFSDLDHGANFCENSTPIQSGLEWEASDNVYIVHILHYKQ
jgi:hypothetical protein